jgi:hypothetical protein
MAVGLGFQEVEGYEKGEVGARRLEVLVLDMIL